MAITSVSSPQKSMLKAVDLQPPLTSLGIAGTYFVTWTALAFGIITPEVITGAHTGGLKYLKQT
ncbi:hypothetical protein M427DRAFT_59795 [Gonapodya prolifera JEL478]|uniref:Uncharacterized protein n=1 Tax=Gonapodya prolifera (strain JEL478) TaxID=1344416 RepID=A0A139A5L2_GONPJ|nr:hypothetical protein M427DRAFT_59795 [Gonapodya prolifera JEL478]|eukprot:KXS12112.1 hypothetical protein M427DRAFT_59795 [Gonapodya prolifera JEL478]